MIRRLSRSLLDRSETRRRKTQVSKRRRHGWFHKKLAFEPLEERRLLATFMVINTEDSGGGSLRQAMTDATNNGITIADDIQFAIPATDSGHVYYADDGVAGSLTRFNVTTTSEADDAAIGDIDPDWPHSWYSIQRNSNLPVFNGQITIDGYSQPGAVENTDSAAFNGVLRIELHGAGAPFSSGSGLLGVGEENVIRGLVINRIPGGNLHNGNAIYLGHFSSIVDSNDHNTIEGNLLGTDVSGTLDLGNTVGVRFIGANADNLIGGTTPQARNLISGNSIGVTTGGDSGGNVIQNNLIGVQRDGVSPLGNSGDGVILNDGDDFTVADNLIAFNAGRGVAAVLGAARNVIQNNQIHSNTAQGVFIDGSDNEIRSNEIYANTLVGVELSSGRANLISGNSLYDNGGLGIDLGGNGVTPNDVGDGDGGVNDQQNFPVITAASSGAGMTNIVGTLNSVDDSPGAQYLVEFFLSDAADPSGHGEGQTPLGSTVVSTDGAGNGTFDVNFATPAGAGAFVSATARDTSNNTSEFSAVFEAEESAVPPVAIPAGPYATLPGRDVLLDGSGSFDPDGGITTLH